MSSFLRSLPFTQQPHVHIRDARHVERLLQNMAAGGRAKLRVISDFDQTLSSHMSNGKRVINSVAIVFPGFPEVERKKLAEITSIYYSKLASSTMNLDEKMRLSVEYRKNATDICVAAKLRRDNFSVAVQNTELPLRQGCDIFMGLLHGNDVPILVFSAGIGDVIQGMFEKNKLVYPNCKVVSNFIKFDEEGKFVGWHEPTIFGFNKNMTVLDEQYFSKEPERTNVLLLGDSEGDLQMADGVPGVDNILKIGFLNGKTENLPKFMESFDIVLVNDESLEVVSAILKKIVDSPSCGN